MSIKSSLVTSEDIDNMKVQLVELENLEREANLAKRAGIDVEESLERIASSKAQLKKMIDVYAN